MRAGLLRESIVIEQKTTAQDAYGQPVPTWAALYSDVPAAAEPEKGREWFVAQQRQSMQPMRFRIRYVDGLTSVSHRVIWNSQTWNIIAPPVDRDSRKRELHLYCEAGVDEQ